jgi:signal transduction histidine kinase
MRTRLTRTATRVVMNPTELEQIVLNLIQNAAQAGAKTVILQTAVVDGHVRIVVRDDGHGIESGDLNASSTRSSRAVRTTEARASD